jgi:hypothetical protein
LIKLCVGSSEGCVWCAVQGAIDDGEGEERSVVFLGQTDGRRCCIESRFESALEGVEGYFEVYDIVGGRLDRVVVEDCVLVRSAKVLVLEMRLGAYYGENSASISHGNWKYMLVITYAQTWVPCSGIMVNRTSSSLSRTQATGPSDARDATNSA